MMLRDAWKRFGPWTDRQYALDKMSLSDLVGAYFTHYSIQVYLLLALILGVLAVATAASPTLPLVAVVATLVIYPFAEYVAHRFVLHSTLLYRWPATAKVWKRIHYDH